MTLNAQQICVDLGSRTVLSAFSATFAPGELVAVAGANGAGKSTALRTLAGLITPASGSVTLDGKPVAEYTRPQLGRQIAYLPQDRVVHWGLTVERVVALGRLPHKGFAQPLSKCDEDAVAMAMKRMDVTHLAQRSASELSGGERARVLLARSLAQDTRYLIADEPAAGLDPAHALSLFEQLTAIAASGKAIITALHDLSFAARFATRVLLFKNGACIADGPPDAVLSQGNLAEAFGIDAVVSRIEGLPVFLPRAALRNSPSMT